MGNAYNLHQKTASTPNNCLTHTSIMELSDCNTPVNSAEYIGGVNFTLDSH